MATHFICQATEPLPHRFPTSRVPEKGHGAVSQYELLNLSDKAHCQFPPPGWDTSESSEDSLPLYRAPAPSWKTSSNLIGPDPDLCITPEKSVANKKINKESRQFTAPVPVESTGKTHFDPDLDLTLTPEKVLENHDKDVKSNLKNGLLEEGKFKGQHRVRFELDNSKGSSEGEDSFLCPKSRPAKPYKPNAYSNQSVPDDKSKTKSVVTSEGKPNKFRVSTSNNRTVYVPLDENEQVKNEVKLANHFDKSENSSVLPEDVYNAQTDTNLGVHIQNHKTPQGSKSKSKIDSNSQKEKLYIKSEETSAPKRKVKVKRETVEQQTEYSYPFADNGLDSAEYEHVFNRPEYNSTLRLRTELQQIKGSEIDLTKALEKKLKLSDSKKTEITEKATSKVNTKESLFSGLVSLEIPVEDLCNQVEQTKTNRVPSKTSRPKTQAAKHSNEPDLMEFFTPELQKEQAEFSLPSLPSPSESLNTASHIRAFDLYRHNRVWDNTSYFSAKKQ